MAKNNSILSEIDKAIEEHQFYTALLPVVTANNLHKEKETEKKLELSGYEGLLRWYHPHHGAMNIANFFAKIERLSEQEKIDGLWQIDKWMLNTIANLSNKINEHEEIRKQPISLNISPYRIFEDNFREEVIKVSSNFNVQKENLWLEISSKGIFQAFEKDLSLKKEIEQTIKSLKQKNVQIIIDNFDLNDFNNLKQALAFTDTLYEIGIQIFKVENQSIQKNFQSLIDYFIEHKKLPIFKGVETYEAINKFNRIITDSNSNPLNDFHYGMQGYILGNELSAENLFHFEQRFYSKNGAREEIFNNCVTTTENKRDGSNFDSILGATSSNSLKVVITGIPTFGSKIKL